MLPLSARHIFISYSRKNEPIMRRIVTFLRKQGIDVWVDNEKLVPGTPIWEVEIEKAIINAGAVVVLLSPDSKNSPWVRREISYAEENDKRIFPVLIAGDERITVPIRLTNHQRIDIREREDLGLSSLATALSFCLEELNRLEEERVAQAKLETERLAKEKADAEQRAKEETERIARQKAEEERIAKAKLEANRLAKEKADADRKAKEEAERIAKQKAEEERIAKSKSETGNIETPRKLVGSPRPSVQRQSIIIWGIIGVMGVCVVVTGGWAISYFSSLNLFTPVSEATKLPMATQTSTGTKPPVATQTSTGTKPSVATQTPTGTKPPVATPTISKYFREEFNTETVLANWDSFSLGSGSNANLVIKQEDDHLMFDLGDSGLYVYYVYTAYEYDNVTISLNAENRGRNNNNISLVCRMSTDRSQWYEFSIANNGLYWIYAYDGSYNILANGGSNSVIQGESVNEYKLVCDSNMITMYVNGDQLKTVTDTKYGFKNGYVGLNISSLNILPITVNVNSFEVGEP